MRPCSAAALERAEPKLDRDDELEPLREVAAEVAARSNRSSARPRRSASVFEVSVAEKTSRRVSSGDLVVGSALGMAGTFARPFRSEGCSGVSMAPSLVVATGQPRRWDVERPNSAQRHAPLPLVRSRGSNLLSAWANRLIFELNATRRLEKTCQRSEFYLVGMPPSQGSDR